MSEDPDAAGGAGTHNLRALVSILGSVAAPPALVIALAYYFAVKRQETLALHFGVDTSVLGYSTQDHLLRGGDTLFLVLLFTSLMGRRSRPDAFEAGAWRQLDVARGWPAVIGALGVRRAPGE